MMHFKIYSGFTDKEPISIDETELEKALIAQITGKVTILKHGSIAGNSISKIVPDFDRAEKRYNPSGPDYLLPSVQEAHYLAIENTGEKIKARMENRAPVLKEPTPAVRVFTNGPTSMAKLLEARGVDQ